MVFIFAIIIFILIVIYFSKVQIQIINLRFSSIKKRKINKDYKIIIRWYILGIIPILKLNIIKAKMEKIKIKEKIKKIQLKDSSKISIKKLKYLKKINVNIKQINLNLEIGTESAALTSIIVPVMSTVIAFILKKKMRKYEDQSFIINPQYINQNLLNISISGIFEFKINHIISIIYFLNKKEGVNKNERTSNRRSYDYSYE